MVFWVATDGLEGDEQIVPSKTHHATNAAPRKVNERPFNIFHIAIGA